jgi:hypothetical protein
LKWQKNTDEQETAISLSSQQEASNRHHAIAHGKCTIQWKNKGCVRPKTKDVWT